MDFLTPYEWQRPLWRSWQQAVQSRLGQAYLLTGCKGVGKQHLAKAMAVSILCKQEKDYLLFEAGTHSDYRFIPEGAGIDEVRAVLEMVEQTAQNYKVILIALVESLSVQAQHALLKTLEEPPGNTVWLLVSAAPALLLPTILSRCQQIFVEPPTKEQALIWLEENIPGATRESYELAFALSQGGILKAKEWLSEEFVWGAWIRGLLTEQTNPIAVTQETLPQLLYIWQLVILDLLYCQRGVPEYCVFSSFRPSLEKYAEHCNPILLGQWLEKLQYWQKQQTSAYLNASWLTKVLYNEWILCTLNFSAVLP